MKRFFVFLGVAFAAIGSAASAQEVDSMVPMQKSSWGDAKTEEVIDYSPMWVPSSWSPARSAMT